MFTELPFSGDVTEVRYPGPHPTENDTSLSGVNTPTSQISFDLKVPHPVVVSTNVGHKVSGQEGVSPGT